MFEHISASDWPVTAYQVVKATGLAGDPLLPVQVYRSLDRLQNEDRVKRVVTLNALVPTQDEYPLHMLCTDCGSVSVISSPQIHSLLDEICEVKGFTLGEVHLEVFGQSIA